MSYKSPSASTLAQNIQFLKEVKIVPMPREIDVPDTVSPDDNLSKEIAGQIKLYSGGGSNKTYYENLFMMRVALKLDATTTKDNIVYHVKKQQCRIFGIVCENGYILIPRCEVALFKSLRSWMFCSPSMKPDVVVFYHSVLHLFANLSTIQFQKQAFNLLKVVRSRGVPLLYIEEQSSTIMQTALCCAFRVVEHHRLLRSIGIETGELFGFAFPRQTEPNDTNTSNATVIGVPADQVDDDDQITEETDADTSIDCLENTSQQQPTNKKARKTTAPIKISVKWVVQHMVFRTTYEVVTYENVWRDLIAAVQRAKEMVQQLTSSPEINSSFLFKLTQHELNQIIETKLKSNKQIKQSKSLGWLQTDSLKKSQLPSAPSFVFELKSESQSDKSCIVKYFVNSTSELKFLLANQVLGTLDETNIQRFCMPLISVNGFYIFEQLLPPLTNLEAKHCNRYLCYEVRKSLQVMHSMNYAHLDVRLPNICYRRSTPDYIPVLIDYERVDFVYECSAHLYISSDLYPRNLTNIYIDYVQLFAMALGTNHGDFIASFVRAASQSKFNDTDLDNWFITFIELLSVDTKRITDIFTERSCTTSYSAPNFVF